MAVSFVMGRGRYPSVSAALVARPWYQSAQFRFQALGIAGVLATLIVWQLLVVSGLVNNSFIPAPSSIAVGLGTLLANGVIAQETLATLSRLVIGYGIGCGLGIAVGFVMAAWPVARAALYPLFAATFPIPKLALLPLLMLLLGVGEEAKIAMVALSAFYFLPLNIIAAIDNIEPIYLQVVKNLGVTRWVYWRTVAVPCAMPMIIAGLRMAWSISLIVIIATEMLMSRDGLGFMIWKSTQVFDVIPMFCAFITIGTLGYGSHVLLDTLTRWLVPWLGTE
jgi:NitT/TauT family transport system permease protein